MVEQKRTGAVQVIRYVAILAAVAFLVSGTVSAVRWLLWVGVVLLIIAIILWLRYFINDRRHPAS